MIPLPEPEDDGRERLAAPEQYRRFVHEAPEHRSFGLSAAFLHPIDSAMPQEPHGSFRDVPCWAPYGAYISTSVDVRPDGPSAYEGATRNPSKWDSALDPGRVDNFVAIADQRVINYYPAADSEAYQAAAIGSSYPTSPPGFARHPHHPPVIPYASPPMYPSFAVNGEDVVPYIFEPMPLGMVAPGFDFIPPADLTSSKDAPAIGTMGSIEYQPLGVSESELAEMWALLQDDEGDKNGSQSGADENSMLLGDAWSTSQEVALDAWSTFGRK